MNLSTANHQIPLNDGNSMPVIGLGTYSDPRPIPGKTYLAVKRAIDEGYRHIDGAYVYRNEHEVGEAIREKIAEGKVKREEIFYCGKLWSTEHVPEMVRPALERTLKLLQLDYIDLYIIEMPMAFKAQIQGSVSAHSNIHLVYDLLQLVKGPVPQIQSCRISMTQGNKITERSPSEDPVSIAEARGLKPDHDSLQ